MLPTISVVTPSFNQGKFIKRTIDSVLSQNYIDLEYLVIDGGSTDDTVEILQQYSGQFTWISEPDDGQTQAINKGFKRSEGDIIAWLNSDDTYLPDTLHTVGAFFAHHPEVDLVYGDFYVIDNQENILLRKQEIPFDYNILLYGLNYIGQPATFFRRSLLDRIGYLDETLHYSMDWEYWLRIASRGGKLALLRQYLATMRWHLTAKTIDAPPAMYAEFETIQQRYLSNAGVHSIWRRHLPMNWLSKIYRLKRQTLKLVTRCTIDYPPGDWVLHNYRT